MQRHPAGTSEIKTSQQFRPQVNTKVDEIVTVVSENLSSGPRTSAPFSIIAFTKLMVSFTTAK